jgi:hypothetical protein
MSNTINKKVYQDKDLTEIYEDTAKASKGKVVKKTIQPLRSGVDQEEWTIDGANNITFMFVVEDFGKKASTLTISIEITTIKGKEKIKRTFDGLQHIDFVKDMYNLFKERLKAISDREVRKQKDKFMSNFKTNIKHK